jgi:peptidylprolyl isomerase
MSEAKQGDKVQGHYTGKLKDETVFDTSQDREPLEFVIGEGRLIPGFEQAVIGMKPNDSKIVTIPAEEAYGPRRDDLVTTVPHEQFPNEMTPQKGQQLDVRLQNGQTRMAVITDVADAGVTLDLNHPLAGQDLKFDILLLGIS